MGEKVSSIELDTPSVSAEKLTAIETAVNEKIRAALPMYPTLYDSVHDPKLSQVGSI